MLVWYFVQHSKICCAVKLLLCLMCDQMWLIAYIFTKGAFYYYILIKIRYEEGILSEIRVKFTSLFGFELS